MNRSAWLQLVCTPHTAPRLQCMGVCLTRIVETIWTLCRWDERSQFSVARCMSWRPHSVEYKKSLLSIPFPSPSIASPSSPSLILSNHSSASCQSTLLPSLYLIQDVSH